MVLSFLSTAAHKLSSKTPDVFAILTACICIGDSCCTCWTHPSLLRLLVELLLHVILPHDVLDPKEDVVRAL